MQKIVAANWKMYKTRAEAALCAEDLLRALGSSLPAQRQVLVFPPFTALAEVAARFAGHAQLDVGAQNFYPEEKGAFTGEISLAMLRDTGAQWVLTGHSERRHVLGENDALVARKSAYALAQGFNVMLCIGEKLEEREAGRLRQVLSTQLKTVVDALPEAARPSLEGRLAVAYEPVWAIGTGKVAGPAEVLEAHAAVRHLLGEMLGSAGQALPVLYGGSVKPDNAASLIQLDNVDGLLVGGASLEAQSFAQIVCAEPLDFS